MSSVIAYVRVSTDDQTNENQRRTIEGRYKVSKWFEEDGVSGTMEEEAPASSDLSSLPWVHPSGAFVISEEGNPMNPLLGVIRTVTIPTLPTGMQLIVGLETPTDFYFDHEEILTEKYGMLTKRDWEPTQELVAPLLKKMYDATLARSQS